MNSTSDWMKFFDECAGRYRYKHKGLGVVRDTLVAIGKVFKTKATEATTKTASVAAENAGQKLGEVVAKKENNKEE